MINVLKVHEAFHVKNSPKDDLWQQFIQETMVVVSVLRKMEMVGQARLFCPFKAVQAEFANGGCSGKYPDSGHCCLLGLDTTGRVNNSYPLTQILSVSVSAERCLLVLGRKTGRFGLEPGSLWLWRC